MNCSRRSFLLNSAAAMGLISLHLPLFGASLRPESRKSYFITGNRGEIYVIDLFGQELNRIHAPFTPHGFARFPGEDRVLIAEREGPNALVLDPRKSAITQNILCPEGKIFYGHAAFSPNGELCVFTAIDKKTAAGHLLGYSVKNWKQEFDWPVTRSIVHDCAFIDSGTLLFSHHGFTKEDKAGDLYNTSDQVETSSLIATDIHTGKNVHKQFLNVANQIAGHFVIARDGAAVLLTMPWANRVANLPSMKGEIYIHRKNAPFLKVELPEQIVKQLRGGFVSACEGSDGLIAVTNPGGGLALLLDPISGKFRQSVRVTSNGVGFSSARNKLIYGEGGAVYEQAPSQAGKAALPFHLGNPEGSGPTPAFLSTHAIAI